MRWMNLRVTKMEGEDCFYVPAVVTATGALCIIDVPTREVIFRESPELVPYTLTTNGLSSLVWSAHLKLDDDPW